MDGAELSSWALVGSLLAGGVLAVAAKGSLCSPALPLGPVASSHDPEEPEKPSGKTWAESLLSFPPWPACSRHCIPRPRPEQGCQLPSGPPHTNFTGAALPLHGGPLPRPAQETGIPLFQLRAARANSGSAAPPSREGLSPACRLHLAHSYCCSGRFVPGSKIQRDVTVPEGS